MNNNDTILKLFELVKEHERNRDEELDFIDKYDSDQNFAWDEGVGEYHDDILESIRLSREKLRDAFRKALSDDTLEI